MWCGRLARPWFSYASEIRRPPGGGRDARTTPARTILIARVCTTGPSPLRGIGMTAFRAARARARARARLLTFVRQNSTRNGPPQAVPTLPGRSAAESSFECVTISRAGCAAEAQICWTMSGGMPEGFERLGLKLLETLHLSVAERSVLPPTGVPASALVEGVGQRLALEGYFPGPVSPDDEWTGARIESRGTEIWVHERYEISVSRIGPVSSRRVSSLREAIRLYVMSNGGDMVDGVLINWDA